MVGVSGPLNTEDRHGATRFVTGIAAGAAVTTLALGIVVAVAAGLLGGVPTVVRIAVAAAALLAFSVLDLMNRTPELERQVPQRFARVLDPGARGMLWGADLATLVSTRKTTSLPWIVLFVVPLSGSPAGAAVALAAANATFVIGVVLQTKAPGTSLLGGRLGAINISREIRQIRRLTAVLVLACAILVALWGFR